MLGKCVAIAREALQHTAIRISIKLKDKISTNLLDRNTVTVLGKFQSQHHANRVLPSLNSRPRSNVYIELLFQSDDQSDRMTFKPTAAG
jgi:hypothetical protein